MQFYRVCKKPSEKADLAIYSHVVDDSGQCKSVSLILAFTLDFNSCDTLVGFCKSSHKYLSMCITAAFSKSIHILFSFLTVMILTLLVTCNAFIGLKEICRLQLMDYVCSSDVQFISVLWGYLMLIPTVSYVFICSHPKNNCL